MTALPPVAALSFYINRPSSQCMVSNTIHPVWISKTLLTGVMIYLHAHKASTVGLGSPGLSLDGFGPTLFL